MTQSPLVLVIDDEHVLRDTLVLILEAEGFRAVAAGEATAALRLAREMQPNLVLCDMLLPGTDGVELARSIRNLLPLVPVILFSGQAAAWGSVATGQPGDEFFEILSKPVRPEILISVIRRQLAQTCQKC